MKKYHCPVCKGEKFELFRSTVCTGRVTAQPLIRVRCVTCGTYGDYKCSTEKEAMKMWDAQCKRMEMWDAQCKRMEGKE